MDVVSIETETVAEENGEREHVTFNVLAKKFQEAVVQGGPPTFIAQTKKHSEKQILKEVSVTSFRLTSVILYYIRSP